MSGGVVAVPGENLTQWCNGSLAEMEEKKRKEVSTARTGKGVDAEKGGFEQDFGVKWKT